jgi:hypothetical protein
VTRLGASAHGERGRPKARAARAIAIAAVVSGATGCSRGQWFDLAMTTTPHVPMQGRPRVGPYEVLAGDLHCHILPPDAPGHVSRELPETVRLAAEEGLDFVVLTPHVPARFFLDPELREWVRGTQSVLRARVDALASNVMVVPGMEYSDPRFGHVGLGFADVGEVLDDLPLDDLLAKPSLFFERWRAHGGLAIINHPTLRPIPQAPFAELRANRSWRDFWPTGRPHDAVFPEIRWLTEHAEGVETHNLSSGHVRDQFFMQDPDWTIRESSHLLDREARLQQRRIAPVGGTDSHGAWLRPTTWVLVTERTTAGVREGVLAGRTCVRGPEGCTLEVRGADGAFHVVGASIAARPPPSTTAIEARAYGGPATYFVNGVASAAGKDGELVQVPVPGRCALVRVVVGRSWSAPVYVDCPWAAPKRGS